VTSSWFFLSTLNYDARSTTHRNTAVAQWTLKIRHCCRTWRQVSLSPDCPKLSSRYVSCCSVTNLTVITSTWANTFCWINRTAMWWKKSTAFAGLLRNCHAISCHLHGWLLLSGRWGGHLTGTAPQLHAASKTHPNLRRTVTNCLWNIPVLIVCKFPVSLPGVS